MDWVRLSKSGQDLTGLGGPRVNGKLREISKGELKKHNTRNDAWMAINGAVFNVTVYMDFHPGGWDELNKGVGMDATDLFNEVHRWVNYEALLAACLVGKLVDGPPELEPTISEPKPTLSEPKPSLQLNPTKPLIPPIPVKPVPTYDYFQTERKVTVNIYTRRKGLSKENFIIENLVDSIRIVCLFPDKAGFILHKHLFGSVESGLLVRVGGGGKLEVDLVKKTTARWQGLGSPLELNAWFGDIKDMKLTYRRYRVKSTQKVTHDTRHLVLQPVQNTHALVPAGHHVLLRGEVEGMSLSRSYTPVVPFEPSIDGLGDLHFLIKVYPDGAFTPLIGALHADDEIDVSDHTGNFSLAQLKDRSHIYLIAAGTGVTPMLRILPHISETETTFMNFNKTENDIIWRAELERFAVKNSWLRIQNIFSEQKTANQLHGRIRREILQPYIQPVEAKRRPLACICGPTPFVKEAERLLKEYFGFSDSELHIFQG